MTYGCDWPASSQSEIVKTELKELESEQNTLDLDLHLYFGAPPEAIPYSNDRVFCFDQFSLVLLPSDFEQASHEDIVVRGDIVVKECPHRLLEALFSLLTYVIEDDTELNRRHFQTLVFSDVFLGFQFLESLASSLYAELLVEVHLSSQSEMRVLLWSSCGFEEFQNEFKLAMAMAPDKVVAGIEIYN